MITLQPVNQAVAVDGTATFQTQAAGALPLTYQWQLNGSNITGATNGYYTVTDALPSTNGYDVVASDPYGSTTSMVAQVVIAAPPTIALQPLSQLIQYGQSATLTVGASGSAPLQYVWRFNQTPIAGAVSGASLELANVQWSTAGSYDVMVTNDYGAITSAVAVVTVRDTNAPAISFPSNVVVQCTSPAGAFVRFAVSATDPYDPTPVVTTTPKEGVFPIGFTTVACVAQDSLGNIRTNYFTVQVTGDCDANYLAIQCPSNIYTDVKGASSVRVDFTVTATNNYTGQPVPVTTSPASGSAFGLGTNEVTCTASAGGAAVTCAFDVIVTNSVPPTIEAPPSVTVFSETNAQGQVGANVNFRVDLLDLADPAAVLKVDPPPGSFFGPGTNFVTVTATEPGGLQTIKRIPVIVQAPLVGDPNADNWGFELPTLYLGWNPSGSAFANGPVVGDVLTVKRITELQSELGTNIGGDYWSNLVYSVGQKGRQWVCTANVYDATPAGAADDLFDDTLTGVMVSKSFVIAHPYVSFLIGGGQDDVNLRVELLVQSPGGSVSFAGQTYNIYDFRTGIGRELMRRDWFDVSRVMGSSARIRIIDNSRTGHLNVDDFLFPDQSPISQTITVGLSNFPAVVNYGGYYYDSDSPVWGFADMHAHPMSYLGFGQKLIHGQPDGGSGSPTDASLGLSDCNCDHGGYDLFSNTCGDYFRQLIMAFTDDGGLDPHRYGWNSNPLMQFSKWPVFTSLSHQQMWYDWIRRAYNGGERVMVALCVNNELLATVSKGDPSAPHDDRTVGDLQISELKNFVSRHSDFMEIAYDPFQLRDIVRRGKLAIIIGSELDDIGNLVRDPNVHPYSFTGALDSYSQQRVHDEIYHLYTNGVRYVFTVHLANNKFGGSPVVDDLLNVGSKFLNGQAEQTQNANAADDINFYLTDLVSAFAAGESDATAAAVAGILLAPLAFAILPVVQPAIDTIAPELTPLGPGGGAGMVLPLLPIMSLATLAGMADPNSALDLVLQIAGVDAADRAQILAANLLPLAGNYPSYPDSSSAPYGVRNAVGLTDLGAYAVKQMMSLGMMLDADHMSQNCLDSVFTIATNIPGGYPLNSGHNSFRELAFMRTENHRSPAQLETIRQLGGMMGVGWENSKDGSYTVSFHDVIPSPVYSISSVANDCAGTSKTWAQLYLYALEKFHGQGVAFGTDADGMIQFPGPRFGPQSAYGLPDSPSTLCPGQIEAQYNGVQYTPTYVNMLMTALDGRSVDPGDETASPRRYLGYEYNRAQATFFAGICMFYYERNNMYAGETQDEVNSDLENLQNAMSSDSPNARHSKEYAFGMIDGMMNWDTGSDFFDGDVGTCQQLGKSIYLTQIGGGSPVSDVLGDATKLARYNDLLIVWNHYQRIFGGNAPLTRCQTGSFKQWDINFEGVAHYGLIPDFLQDLSNVGLQSSDMSVLFHSADAFAQMWIKCLQGSYAFQPHFSGSFTPIAKGILAIDYLCGDDNYIVEQSPSLGAAASWSPATVISASTNGIVRTVQVPVSSEAMFYRLHLQ